MINILNAKNNQEKTICNPFLDLKLLHFWLNMKISKYIFYKVAFVSLII